MSRSPSTRTPSAPGSRSTPARSTRLSEDAMKRFGTIVVLVGGVALGWLARGGVEPRTRDDRALTASLSQLRSDIQALQRAVAVRPARSTATACAPPEAAPAAPAAGATEPAPEAAGPAA